MDSINLFTPAIFDNLAYILMIVLVGSFFVAALQVLFCWHGSAKDIRLSRLILSHLDEQTKKDVLEKLQ